MNFTTMEIRFFCLSCYFVLDRLSFHLWNEMHRDLERPRPQIKKKERATEKKRPSQEKRPPQQQKTDEDNQSPQDRVYQRNLPD